jgi:hypothetical protein
LNEGERRLFLQGTDFFRRQRHDFLNAMQIVRGHVQLGNPEKALACIEETVKALAPQQEISRIAEELLQALILHWYLELSGHGAQVSVRVAEEFGGLTAVCAEDGPAAAFQAFIAACAAATGCGQEGGGQSGGGGEISLTAVIELTAEGGLACRYLFGREGEKPQERLFQFRDSVDV